MTETNQNSHKLDSLISDILIELPQTDFWSKDTENVTADFLVCWANNRSGYLSELLRLCRKVDIAKKVATSYDAQWQSPIDRRPISPSFLMLLAMAFLDLAIQSGDESPEALKYLNTAFNAMDMCDESQGPTSVSALYDFAATLLDEHTKP